MKVISYSQARNNLKSVLDSAIEDADVTVITRRDGQNAVVMGQDYFDSLTETLYLLSTPANARALHCAIAQDREGQAQPRQLIDTP